MDEENERMRKKEDVEATKELGRNEQSRWKKEKSERQKSCKTLEEQARRRRKPMSGGTSSVQ